jgi:hypothetical protein
MVDGWLVWALHYPNLRGLSIEPSFVKGTFWVSNSQMSLGLVIGEELTHVNLSPDDGTFHKDK